MHLIQPSQRPRKSGKAAGGLSYLNQALLGGAAGVVLMIGLIVVATAWRNNLGKRTDPATVPALGQRPQRMARGDFQGAVLGKTPEQVRAALGDPDGVVDDPDHVVLFWRYDGLTFTPPAKNSDLWALIHWDYVQPCVKRELHGAHLVEYPGRVFAGPNTR